MSYLFQSSRLGFRNWRDEDLDAFAAITGDELVMEFFPATLSREETAALIGRLQKSYADHGYTYFAVELLETGEFIGFIGLAHQTYREDMPPFVDIGWRLATEYWGKGYATEGAKRCVEHARDDLGIRQLYATTPRVNVRSQRVMEKIGLAFDHDYVHPNLPADDFLQPLGFYKMEL